MFLFHVFYSHYIYEKWDVLQVLTEVGYGLYLVFLIIDLLLALFQENQHKKIIESQQKQKKIIE
jgi:preprotein translocase subunit SecG